MEFSHEERIAIVTDELKQAVAAYLDCRDGETEAEHQLKGERVKEAHALIAAQPVEIRTAIRAQLSQ